MRFRVIVTKGQVRTRIDGEFTFLGASVRHAKDLAVERFTNLGILCDSRLYTETFLSVDSISRHSFNVITSNMRSLLLSLGLLICTISFVSATALTYKLAPNEKACFFTYVEQKNAKVAFYFAVRTHCSLCDANDAG